MAGIDSDPSKNTFDTDPVRKSFVLRALGNLADRASKWFHEDDYADIGPHPDGSVSQNAAGEFPGLAQHYY